jgi:hypothetical protein
MRQQSSPHRSASARRCRRAARPLVQCNQRCCSSAGRQTSGTSAAANRAFCPRTETGGCRRTREPRTPPGKLCLCPPSPQPLRQNAGGRHGAPLYSNITSRILRAFPRRHAKRIRLAGKVAQGARGSRSGRDRLFPARQPEIVALHGIRAARSRRATGMRQPSARRAGPAPGRPPGQVPWHGPALGCACA